MSMKVYAFVPRMGNASYYYRLSVPLDTATVLGLPMMTVIDTDDAGIQLEERVRNFCESDVVLIYQPVGEGNLHNMRQIQQYIPCKRDGDWKWPPTCIIETDDNIFDVSPMNPAYKGLGTRVDGVEMPDGQSVGVIENGEKIVKWMDGHKCSDECGNCGKEISFARNRSLMNVYRAMLDSADCVQCSTPHLEKVVQKEACPRRTQVFPNLVRFDHYEQLDLAPNKKVKILWQGGHNHYEDWFPLREVLGRITEKYPEVHWIICGVFYHWIKELIPADRYTFYDWRPYQEYKLRHVMYGHDISLAPLRPTTFNNCRSAIKFYESSVIYRPAATLAQNAGPYRDEIIEGETGLLFKDTQEFEAKLSTLIENETYRRTLGTNAKQWISEHRDAMKEVPKMVAFWEQLREERKLEQPHVTDDHWLEIEAQVEAEDKARQEAMVA